MIKIRGIYNNEQLVDIEINPSYFMEFYSPENSKAFYMHLYEKEPFGECDFKTGFIWKTFSDNEISIQKIKYYTNLWF